MPITSLVNMSIDRFKKLVLVRLLSIPCLVQVPNPRERGHLLLG